MIPSPFDRQGQIEKFGGCEVISVVNWTKEGTKLMNYCSMLARTAHLDIFAKEVPSDMLSQISALDISSIMKQAIEKPQDVTKQSSRLLCTLRALVKWNLCPKKML